MDAVPFVPTKDATGPGADAEIDLTAPAPSQSFLSMALSLPPPPSSVSESQLSVLKQQGFPSGLSSALYESATVHFPLRIWVVDNSGSMRANDGSRFVETTRRNDVKVVRCTRWREIRETVEYHAEMAALLGAPTAFRMLNDPGIGNLGSVVGVGTAQKFSVACGDGGSTPEDDLRRAREIMHKSQPRGVTPLAFHIREIRDEVAAHADVLRQRGQRVAIILATDGLPTDNGGKCNDYFKADFVEAIKSLEGLPVWVVVRLCTDDEAVVNFYNDLDGQLEFSVEVLDDYEREALEVHEYARWLTYGLPLHRCREMGFHDRLFDLLEERQLSRDELRDFCVLLFGKGKMDGVPEASVDIGGFCKAVEGIVEAEGKQYNPIKRRPAEWIDVKRMKRDYKHGCAIM